MGSKRRTRRCGSEGDEEPSRGDIEELRILARVKFVDQDLPTVLKYQDGCALRMPITCGKGSIAVSVIVGKAR